MASLRSLLTRRKLLVAAAVVVVAVLIFRPRSNWPQPVWSAELPGWVAGWSHDGDSFFVLSDDWRERTDNARSIVSVDAATGAGTVLASLPLDAFLDDDEKTDTNLVRIDQLADGRLIAAADHTRAALVAIEPASGRVSPPVVVADRSLDSVRVSDVRQTGSALLVAVEHVTDPVRKASSGGHIELVTVPLDLFDAATSEKATPIARQTIERTVVSLPRASSPLRTRRTNRRCSFCSWMSSAAGCCLWQPAFGF